MSPDPDADDERVPTSRRTFLTAAAGVGAASLAAGSAAAAGCGDDAADGDAEEAMADSEPFAAVEYSNQYTEGSEIYVDSTVLSDGGYVAIHDATLFQGEITGSVVGVSDYLEPGAHYRVPVDLFDVPGADFDRSALESTEVLVPMPHQETSGNETYDFVASGGEDDGPYAGAELPVVDAGFATVDGEASAGGPFATVDFRNQSVADGTAVVRDVTVSEGGFIAMHDARLLGGDALGSVVGASDYLEPGQHQAVEVPIEDPSGIAEVELPARPLVPMPHMDTNGNEALDFLTSEGADDGPYTKAGQAVIGAGLVTVE
ncbi:hypothetical protein ACKVMT_10790 [Halobacteriales archaeon Cl-PHB]